ncbi:hypothetical protein ACFV6F_18045 [Kitasatospora phosalacinea]|uniref:hypothetical protein n=1 Tax=Kitasatospora phosalacinea TaxID=2065 RepID=UPI00364F0B9C
MPDHELSMLCSAAISETAGQLVRRLTGDDPQTEQLARLRVLAHLQFAVAQQSDQAAVDAVRSGAGYPQLGQAVGLTRQGARRRWPGLVTVRVDHAARAVQPFSPPTDRSR